MSDIECLYADTAAGDRRCSLIEGLRLDEGTKADWAALAPLHYRSHTLGGLDRLWALRSGDDLVAVAAYCYPPANLAARNRALALLVARLPVRGRMRFWNANLRIISRVVVDPNWRGLGLAARLVRETLPRAGVAYVEAQAAMGRVHPFFERAGMTRYDTAPPKEAVRLREALATAGIRRRDLRSGAALLAAVEAVGDPAVRRWLDEELRRWMRSYLGAKTPKTVRTTPEATCGYVARFLYSCPVYFLWADPERVSG